MNNHRQDMGTYPGQEASSHNLEHYLSEIASQLNVDPTSEADILEELRSHLEEATAELQAGGLGEEESLVAAMERFGTARE